MSCKSLTIFGCAVVSLAFIGAGVARAQETEEGAQEASGEQADAEQMRLLREELEYSSALIYAGLPDFAEDVIAAAKKRWPEAETLAFAIEIRGMLSLGKFEEAEKKIAALPDRNSAKYWAARLEVANSYFQRNKREECAKIYEDFFKSPLLAGKSADKALVEIARNARYQYGQLLLGANRIKEAAEQLDTLLTMLRPQVSQEDDDMWCNVAGETADLYLRLSSEDEKGRGGHLDRAKKYIDKLLWRQDKPVFFGRAIAQKAYYELQRGSMEKAQAVVNDYKDQLQQLHEQLEQADPKGTLGLLSMSPMPQCRYLMAEMYWKAAEAEYKKPKRDDEKVKSLLFGARKGGGKKRDGQGAFNNAVNVYLRYPQSVWAPKAGKLQDTIAEFVIQAYGTDPRKGVKATPEQVKRVISAQFQRAAELFAEGKYSEAEPAYAEALANYPECEEAVLAVENIATGYLNRIAGDGEGEKADADTKQGWRFYADAVEGYLAERFASNPDDKVMTAAGNAVMRLASREKEIEGSNRALGVTNRAQNLQYDFVNNYVRHVSAASMAYSVATDLQRKACPPEGAAEAAPDREVRDELLREALRFYVAITNNFPKTKVYPHALAQMSFCYDKLGEGARATAVMEKYVATIDGKARPLVKLNAELGLASRHYKTGLMRLAAIERLGSDQQEKRNKIRKLGITDVLNAVKTYETLVARAEANLGRPDVPAADKPKYVAAAEQALFNAADGLNRIPGDDATIAANRRKAVSLLEKGVELAPKGKLTAAALERLGRLYSQLDDIDKSRNALLKLKREFPESSQAKRALPQLAKALVSYSKKIEDPEQKAKMIAEVREIYDSMLNNASGAYSPHDYVLAGNVLLEAESYDLALMAFQKAEAAAQKAKSKRNLADARVGLSRVSLQKGDLAYARATLDAIMDDKELSGLSIVTNAYDMMSQVATAQARKEPDAAKRRQLFNDALGAISKLKRTWSRSKDKDGNPTVPGWQIDQLDLRRYSTFITQMRVEKDRGDKDAADKALRNAVLGLDTFVKNRLPTPDNPLSDDPKDIKNMTSALDVLIDLLEEMDMTDGGQADDVAAACRQYLELFPNGERAAHVQHVLNEAYKRGAKEKTEEKPVEATEPEEEPEEVPAEPAAETPEAPAAEAPAAETQAEPAVETPAEPSAEEPAGTEAEPKAGEAAEETTSEN